MHRPKYAVSGLVAVLIISFLIFLPSEHRPFAQAEPTPAQPSQPAITDPLHPTENFIADANQKTLNDAFASRTVAYYADDQIKAFPDPSLGLGSLITVHRALPVTIRDGKREHVYRTWVGTVGDLFKERLIELGQEDRVNFTPATPLTTNMTVIITRVARTQVTEKEIIPFQTVVEKDYSQFVGAQKVLQAGKNGEREKLYLLIREDGELVSKTLLKTTTTIAPQTERTEQGGLNPVSSQCATLKDWVVDASAKNRINPNGLYNRIVMESNCHSNSSGMGGKYLGLLQYEEGFWNSVSAKAGLSGASIWDAKSQIYVTAWAWGHGYRSRWP